jgi:3-isopropylmalate dehydratase small subunit
LTRRATSPKFCPPELQFLISLAGAGVKAVIAKSFAFIYGRNQPSLSLLGITISDDAFLEAVTDGEQVTIDVPTRTIVVGGRKEFKVKMAETEYRLTVNKGISESYKMYGKAILEKLTKSALGVKVGMGRFLDKRMEW